MLYSPNHRWRHRENQGKNKAAGDLRVALFPSKDSLVRIEAGEAYPPHYALHPHAHVMWVTN